MSDDSRLRELCRRFDVVAVYLFGSRAGDGLRALARERVEGGGSDLDVGLVFTTATFDALALSSLQVAMEDVFAPLQVDLVPLQRVDPLLAFAAIDGHRIATVDATATDRFELATMRSAAELLPVQRRIERETFGTSTT